VKIAQGMGVEAARARPPLGSFADQFREANKMQGAFFRESSWLYYDLGLISVGRRVLAPIVLLWPYSRSWPLSCHGGHRSHENCNRWTDPEAKSPRIRRPLIKQRKKTHRSFAGQRASWIGFLAPRPLRLIGAFDAAAAMATDRRGRRPVKTQAAVP